MCTCIYIYVQVHVCTFVYTYARVCVYMYICTHTYIYIYMCVSGLSSLCWGVLKLFWYFLNLIELAQVSLTWIHVNPIINRHHAVRIAPWHCLQFTVIGSGSCSVTCTQFHHDASRAKMHTHAVVLAMSQARPDHACMFQMLILLVAEPRGPASPAQGT